MSHMPADLGLLGGFHGCVFDVRAAQDPGGPWRKPPIIHSRNVAQCGTDACKNNKCQNNAICHKMGATYR